MDKFKGALTAEVACRQIALVLKKVFPEEPVEEFPITDGGEGFGRIVTRLLGGTEKRVRVSGPDGQRCEASFGLVPRDHVPEGMLRTTSPFLGVIEMASASGLDKIPRDQLNPWTTSTFGTGQLIRETCQAGAREVLVGLGGSGTSDLGTGALMALGLSGSGISGERALGCPADWSYLRHLRWEPEILPEFLHLATDVRNPTFGYEGAARIFAPQKGAGPEMVEDLEREGQLWMERLNLIIPGADKLALQEGSGAAGGLAFGLSLMGPHRIFSGFEWLVQAAGLSEKIHSCQAVITGEGQWDDTSFSGKGPGTLVKMALDAGKDVIIFTGRNQMQRRIEGLKVIEITPDSMALPEALARSGELLAKAVRREFGGSQGSIALS